MQPEIDAENAYGTHSGKKEVNLQFQEESGLSQLIKMQVALGHQFGSKTWCRERSWGINLIRDKRHLKM